MKTNDILLKFQSNNNKLETVLNQKKVFRRRKKSPS